MQLQVQEYKLPDAIRFNFEELKTAITEKTEQYTKIVYTDENIKAAKEDRADLNRLKKALNDERIRRQKEYMGPFDEFKRQIDEIIGIIDKPVQSIDRQVKEFEAIKQDEKRMNIEDMFGNMLFPDFVKIDQLWNPKWANATYMMKQIEEELLKQKEDIIRNCQTLATLPSYSHEAVIFYQKTLDMGGALAKVSELAEVEAKKKKMLEEEAQRKQTEDAFIPVPEQKPLIEVERIPEEAAASEPRMWVSFAALINKTEAEALKAFFDEHRINFKPIKIKED